MIANKEQWPQWLIHRLLLVISLLFAWQFTQSLMVLDTARDLSAALQIAQGQHFPLQGPDVGGRFHLGPIWFYFLAIPAWFGSLWVVAFFVGVVAALKFYLAYLLGKSLLGWQFGVLWAVCLLLPGWHSLNPVIINHFNWVETMTLACLLMMVRFHQSSELRYWYASVVFWVLGIHAHPTVAVIGLFYLPVIIFNRKYISFSALLPSLLIFILPFVPYFWHQIQTGFPDWVRFTELNATSDQAKATGSLVEQRHWLTHTFQNLQALFVKGPHRVFEIVNHHLGGVGMFWVVTWYFVALLGMTGWLIMLIKRPLNMRVCGIAVFLGLLSLLLVSLMRSFTPFYMVLVLSPLCLGWVALGCMLWVRRHPSLLALLIVVITSSSLLMPAAWRHALENQQLNLGNTMNITDAAEPQWITQPTLDVISLQEHSEIAQAFCNSGAVINGQLAAPLETSSGVPLQWECGHQNILMGGVHAGLPAVFTMRSDFWDAAQISPLSWLTTHWGQTDQYQNLTPQSQWTFATFDGNTYPPRSHMAPGPMRKQVMIFEETSSTHLLISNILPNNIGMQVQEVKANQRKVTPLISNLSNLLYECKHCQSGEKIKWEISIKTNEAKAIDINGFSR